MPGFPAGPGRAGFAGPSLPAAGLGGERDQRGREVHLGGGTAVRRHAQRHRDAVPCRQERDSEQAHVPGDRHVREGVAGQLPVEQRQFLLGHARSAVGNGDERAAANQRVPGHDDLGRLRRKRGGVLQQFGEQVHGVGRSDPADADTLLDVQNDSVVLRYLGRCGPEHVSQVQRLGRARGLVAGEDERAV